MNFLKYLSLFFIAVFNATNITDTINFFSAIETKLNEEEKNKLTEIKEIFKTRTKNVEQNYKLTELVEHYESGKEQEKKLELMEQNRKLCELLNNYQSGEENKKQVQLIDELNNQLKISEASLNKETQSCSHQQQLNVELTSKNVLFESESKKLKQENKELKKSPFLPKTAKGWVGLSLLLVGTVLVARMYHTLYMT